jgi:asparagine synthase (glutamine-hydrolysing)
MADALHHRGPDAAAYWSDGQDSIFLGHRRLTVLDPEGGAQPMWTADGRIGIVFNGEIYNFRELRAKLERVGHRFGSDHSDTEVLLYGYREWGTEVVSRLNGMWAFALVDRDRKRLFCSRDRFGKKPLYYYAKPGLFAFASEATALAAHPAIRLTVSPLALRKYFAYGYIPAPRSMFEGVHKLPGGHSLLYDWRSGAAHVVRYWEFLLEPDDVRPADYEESCAEEVRSLLEAAVTRRMVADVPIGIFLSGGIDSSAIAALSAKNAPPGAVKTFSIAFREAQYDESRYARLVARHVCSDHRVHTLSAEGARELLPQIFSHLDEPLGDSSLLPTYLLCRHTREHVTVALGGDGADELFAGYAPFKALRWARLYQRAIGSKLHRGILNVVSRLPVSHGYLSLDLKLKRALRGVSYPARMWNPMWLCPLDERELSEFLSEPVDLDDLFAEAIEAWDRQPHANDVDRTLQFYTRLYLQDDILMKVDRASMLNSLEVRAPFLDIDLVNRVRRIPSELKLRGGTTKYILRKALAGLLPNETLKRSKQGFAIPIGSWFARRELSLDFSRGTVLVNQPFTLAKLSEHIRGGADHRWFLWNQWALSKVQTRYSLGQA